MKSGDDSVFPAGNWSGVGSGRPLHISACTATGAAIPDHVRGSSEFESRNICLLARLWSIPCPLARTVRRSIRPARIGWAGPQSRVQADIRISVPCSPGCPRLSDKVPDVADRPQLNSACLAVDVVSLTSFYLIPRDLCILVSESIKRRFGQPRGEKTFSSQ